MIPALCLQILLYPLNPGSSCSDLNQILQEIVKLVQACQQVFLSYVPDLSCTMSPTKNKRRTAEA